MMGEKLKQQRAAHKPHIVMVISSLGPGGAEKITSMLAGHWYRKGFAVTVVTLTRHSHDHFKLDSGVCRVSLNFQAHSRNVWESLRNNLRHISRLRKTIRSLQPGCVVSFIDDTNLRVLLALLWTGIPVFVSERTDPRHHDIGRARQILRRILYPLATAVVVQTGGVRNWALQLLRQDKIAVIPNPVDALRDDAEVGNSADVDKQTVFAMGRMGPEKGFDMLLDAYARSNILQLGWRLVILGDGRERATLQQQAERLGIAHTVLMPGTVAEPRAWLRRGGYFVLSSRFEGFPNALLEAMAEGLPAVAFDCESGPADIVRNDVDGLLVPAGDVAALAEAMRRLAEDATLRTRYAQRAKEVLQRFALQRISTQWEELLDRNIKHE
ncbi:MAG TPA: glycosyltransferase family 4 protein [Gallionellaceae bacterium]